MLTRVELNARWSFVILVVIPVVVVEMNRRRSLGLRLNGWNGAELRAFGFGRNNGARNIPLDGRGSCLLGSLGSFAPLVTELLIPSGVLRNWLLASDELAHLLGVCGEVFVKVLLKELRNVASATGAIALVQ
jgi:hypothetical protein